MTLPGYSGTVDLQLRQARGVSQSRASERCRWRYGWSSGRFSELCITVGTLIVLFVVYVLFWTGVQADSAHGRARSTGSRTSGRRGRRARRRRGSRRQDRPGGRGADRRAAPRTTGRQVLRDHVHPALRPRTGTSPSSRAPAPDPARRASATTPRTARLGPEGQLRRRRPPPHLRRPLQGLPQAAARRRRGADRRHDLVHVPDRQSGPTAPLPSDIGVIDPCARDKSGYHDGPGRYLTLTTCDPEWGHSHRLIVWAHLDATQPVEAEGNRRLCAADPTLVACTAVESGARGATERGTACTAGSGGICRATRGCGR